MNDAYLVLSEEERAKGFVRPVYRSYRHLGCGHITTMGQALAETYAAKPTFYTHTYCAHCAMHKSVGAYGEFVWVNSHGRTIEIERDGESVPMKVGT